MTFEYTAIYREEGLRAGSFDNEYARSGNGIAGFQHANFASLKAHRTGGEMREFTHGLQYTGEVFAVSARTTLAEVGLVR